MILNIIEANYLDGFRVKLLFNDGLEKIVDLKDYMNSKKHPLFQSLKRIEEFKKFKLHKTLIWDTGADIAPEYLYNID
jgi:hypothetical protein